MLTRVPEWVDEIIVVSNRSTDDTVERARETKAKVLVDDRADDGIGYGYAHMTGIAAATGELIASADGDLTYPIENLGMIIDTLFEKNLDFISCNRYPLQTGTKIPFMLQLGVNVLNWESLLLYGINIQDILSGMWVFKKEIREKLHLTQGEWNLSPQIKLNAAQHPEIKFSEYSIAQYQRNGTTKQNYWKTGFSHLFWIFKNRFTKKSF